MSDPKRSGRPALDASGHPSTAVHLKLAAADFDQAAKLARTRRETVQDVIRDGLKRLLQDDHGGGI